jgi:hypothetical protein
MTAINLDDQIVGSTFDPQTRICTYTYEHHDGSRYTVSVPIDDLNKIGTTPATLQQRRDHIARRIMGHMQTNPPDPKPEPPPAATDESAA